MKCRSCLYWNNRCTYTENPTLETCAYAPASSVKTNKGKRIWQNKKDKSSKQSLNRLEL